MTPTDEQIAAAEAFRHNELLKISAFAGAGKTTTLQLLSQTSREKGIYLAFNKAIADYAQTRFDRRVACHTTHSIAWRAIKSSRNFSEGKMGGKLSAAALAQALKISDLRITATLTLTPIQHAHLLASTVARFCQSADDTIAAQHVPHYRRLENLPSSILTSIKDYAAEEAETLWERMSAPGDDIPLGHDGYLKLWALSAPRLPYDYILLDEAQDTNAVVLGVLRQQACKRVFIGDTHQEIYQWRGGTNAMQTIKGGAETFLTQSFRFGETLAEKATLVLRTLDETRILRGNPALQTNIQPADPAQPSDCVLARTNSRVITEIVGSLEADRKPFILGGAYDLTRMLTDVTNLKNARPALCPELFGFADWDQVKEFAGTEEGEDLTAFVNLVGQHGEGTLKDALARTPKLLKDADLTIGTAHKAKGCEWKSVRLAGDFLSQRGPAGDTPRAEIRLFYVAMTRARETLSVDPDLLEAFTHPHTAALKRQREAADTQASPQAPTPPRNRAREALSRILNRAAQHQSPRPDQS